jgi:hypothetical protein
MSTNAYFPTEEAHKAKNWDILQQFQKEKANRARLENEVVSKSQVLANVARLLSDPRNNEFLCRDSALAVLRANPKAPPEKNELAEISWRDINTQFLSDLLNELEESKRSMQRLTLQVRELGLLPALSYPHEI